MDIFKKIKQFISYWYVRYLLATELYMVDTWEQIVVHLTITNSFIMFWYFNYVIVTSCLSKMRLNPSSHNLELIL